MQTTHDSDLGTRITKDVLCVIFAPPMIIGLICFGLGMFYLDRKNGERTGQLSGGNHRPSQLRHGSVPFFEEKEVPFQFVPKATSMLRIPMMRNGLANNFSTPQDDRHPKDHIQAWQG